MTDYIEDFGPNYENGRTYFLYAKPNPALAEILLGDRVRDVTWDWTAKVGGSYVAKLQARTHTDDRHPSYLESTVDASVYIGGYESDRWVGEIKVGADYALADEYGRHTPSPGQHGSTTEGHHDLADSLYENLPQI